MSGARGTRLARPPLQHLPDAERGGAPVPGHQSPRSDRRGRPDRPLGGLDRPGLLPRRRTRSDPLRRTLTARRVLTAAALAGKPNWQIRKQSGHKTDVMLNRYIRDGRLFADHPLEGLL
ncbi:MAG: hypothetical protein R3F40_14360 [Candidatus Competibacteraceae bacterium]